MVVMEVVLHSILLLQQAEVVVVILLQQVEEVAAIQLDQHITMEVHIILHQE